MLLLAPKALVAPDRDGEQQFFPNECMSAKSRETLICPPYFKTDQQLDCALDLMRRLPPQQIESNLSDLIDLVPDLCEVIH